PELFRERLELRLRLGELQLELSRIDPLRLGHEEPSTEQLVLLEQQRVRATKSIPLSGDLRELRFLARELCGEDLFADEPRLELADACSERAVCRGGLELGHVASGKTCAIGCRVSIRLEPSLRSHPVRSRWPEAISGPRVVASRRASLRARCHR